MSVRNKITKSTLNPKQQRFCWEYALKLDGKAAAVAVGYAEANASQQSSLLLKREDIQRQIALNLKNLDLRSELTGGWVIEKLRMIASFNIATFLRVDEVSGQVYYDFSHATDDDWYAIGEITIDSVPRGSGDNRVDVDKVKIKPEGKMKALELLAKHTGIVSDKIDMTVLNVHTTIDSSDLAAVSQLHHQLLTLERQQQVIEHEALSGNVVPINGDDQ